ncbi:SAF domain-containing protein [Arthrobacter cupressi]|uniref:SAF domain-containing protein n=1 Tax=Arthrobacter cupressi TaxID=1045773 RepID=A0A1G8P1T8_9MICC|nr:SAF domain-containing protein [Arthrobacter cupressi]NYD76698.1 Flp pilus assembly protein CpaB [Arthrobacter cupressi]SDI86437.1 SAF domain-containing protein [Arthrobacter cupressi]
MSASTTAAAARLKKPSWKDPRLLVGILLVLASVAGVIALVGAADRTVQVYVAREGIAVGQKLSRDDLSVAKVRLDDVESGYVTVESGLPEGKVAVQRVAKNQLLPRESLGDADALDRKPVAVTVEDSLPAQAVPGSRVDVWVSLPDAQNGFAEPRLLLPGAEIAQVTEGSSALGASKQTVVLVLVTDEQMPKLLGAQANKAKVAVVWNPAGTVK